MLIALIAALVLGGAVAAAWLARRDTNAVESSAALAFRARPYVGETKPLGSTPAANDLPTHVITWKLAITKNGGLIGFDYDKVAEHRLAAGQSIDDYLTLLATERPPQGLNWHEPNLKPRPAHQPRETPLSIEHNGYSYIVYWLEDVNWHFTAEHEPFEIQAGKEDLYRDPRCAYLVGTTPRVRRAPESGARCRVASFISNGAANQAGGDDLDEFVTPFNFYVTIRSTKGGRTRYLPLVIDPDVGYPGGNYP